MPLELDELLELEELLEATPEEELEELLLEATPEDELEELLDTVPLLDDEELELELLEVSVPPQAASNTAELLINKPLKMRKPVRRTYSLCITVS